MPGPGCSFDVSLKLIILTYYLTPYFKVKILLVQDSKEKYRISGQNLIIFMCEGKNRAIRSYFSWIIFIILRMVYLIGPLTLKESYHQKLSRNEKSLFCTTSDRKKIV